MKKVKCYLEDKVYKYKIVSKSPDVSDVIYDSLILLMKTYGDSPEIIKRYESMTRYMFGTNIFLIPMPIAWEKRNGYYIKFFSISSSHISELTAMSLISVLERDLP